ncbi:hypothetical protein B566_EDAN009059 [Ephemera danica]|nr:hypothetical protein B566_EDAN009059 [Ephemera danica]
MSDANYDLFAENYAIGIDLGTTNCCVAVYIDGKVKIITNNIGKTTTPSTIFKVKESNGDPVIHVTKGKRKQWKPEEISGLVLGEMRRIASVYLDTEIFDAVVTIPAYFNELQREATKRACAQAGLNILRIINEPTAAAIAYGVQNPSEQPRTVLVFDFGGGTCDVSILQMEKKRYTVLASYGDNKLGGEDFDDILMDHLVQKFEEKHPLKLDPRDKRRLRRQCERAKRDLTDYYEGEIVVERVAGTISDLRETVTRKQFLSLTSDLFPRVLMPVKQCLQDAKLRPSDIDEVVLVGGSSRLLPIQELLSDFFRGKKLHVRTDPDEAIAFGAAIQAAISSGQHGDNPPVIREITPMSLGVGVHGNKMHVITPKNTPLPTKATYRFQTVENYQEEVVIEVYQGENVNSASKNTLLGTFTMHNIRKAPAGQVQLDETFSINEDGILSVTAVEVGTKNVVQVKVQKPVK